MLARKVWLALAGLALLLSLAACGLGEAPRGRRAAADWSRGAPVGAGVGGAAGMYVTPGGDRIYLVWPTTVAGQERLHYELYDATAVSLAERDLALSEGAVRSPHMLPAADGGVHLVWASRPPNSRGWSLEYVRLSAAGDLLSSRQRLSPADSFVADITAVADPAGGGYVAWEGSGNRIYIARFDAGDLIGQPQLIAAGQQPALALDSQGALHLAWQDEVDIRYASWPAGQPPDGTAPLPGQVVVHTGLVPSTTSLTHLSLGAAGDRVYLFWSLFNTRGLEAGIGRTEYVSFPRGRPSQLPPSPLQLGLDAEPAYRAHEGALNISQLVPPLVSVAGSSAFIADPEAAAYGDELAVVVATNQAQRQQIVVQLALVLFRDGQPVGYQMAANTPTISRGGQLAVDGNGHLYLVWRERADGSVLYYATTAPEARAELDRVQLREALNLLLGALVEMIAGILFFPLALVWLVPGAIILGIWRLRRDDEQVEWPSSVFLLLVAVIILERLKLAFMPSILSYVPLSAWFDFRTAWDLPLQIGYPFFTLLIGLLAAEIVRRRRDETSTLYYFIILGLVDAVLTLAVYGVNFLGVL